MELGGVSFYNRFIQSRLVTPQELGSNGTTHQLCQRGPDKTKGNHPQVIAHEPLADKYAEDTRWRLEA